MELAANALDMIHLNLCKYAERRTLGSFENNPQVMKNMEHLFAVLFVSLFVFLFREFDIFCELFSFLS